MYMKTLIAVPCMDYVPVKFTESLLNMVKPEGTKLSFKSGSLVYDARNLLSLTAIENDFDVVLWIDSDMQFEPDLLIRMAQDLDDGADMVTGVYFKRVLPTKPVLYSRVDAPVKVDGHLIGQVEDYLDYPQKQVFQVAGCGFGACMTRVSLLKQVWDKFGPAFSPLPWASEDISFCWRVGQLGVKIYADSRIRLGHIGQAIFTEDVYKHNRG